MSDTEHFCVVVNRREMLLMLALYESLDRHLGRFRLWCLCTDEVVEERLRGLPLPNLEIVDRHLVETPALLAVRRNRADHEYRWTLKPFFMAYLLDLQGGPRRVSYVDNDISFLHHPGALFTGFERETVDAVLSEHAHSSRYDWKEKIYGRFSAQFLTVRRGPRGLEMLRWWADSCLARCSDVPLVGAFGDQKYLERWPELFGDSVATLSNPLLALGPWNEGEWQPGFQPVFYHFQSLGFVHARLVLLFVHWKIGKAARSLYAPYLDSIQRQIAFVERNGIAYDLPTARREPWWRHVKRWVMGEAVFAWFPFTPRQPGPRTVPAIPPEAARISV